MTTTAFDDPKNFDEVEWQAWQLMQRGVTNRNHGFHRPVVATFGRDGYPQARIVILRAADRKTATLRFHTDVRSEKWLELNSNPKISVTLYDEAARVQLRLNGETQAFSQNASARKFWEQSQPMSRVCYGVQPASGSEITDGLGYTLPEKVPMTETGYENFGAIEIHVQILDWLSLKQGKNRRARIDYVEKTKKWLVP